MEIKEYLKGKDFLLYRFYDDPQIIYLNEIDIEELENLLNLLLDDFNFIKKLNYELIDKLLKMNFKVEINQKLLFSKKILIKHNEQISIFFKDDNMYLNQIKLLCNNELLDYLELSIDTINDSKLLKNISQILITSIEIKEKKYEDILIYKKIDKNNIKEFNLKKCNELYKKVNNKIRYKSLKLVGDKNDDTKQ